MVLFFVPASLSTISKSSSDSFQTCLSNGVITVFPKLIFLDSLVRNKENKIELDGLGQVKLQHAEEGIRLAREPFPLYPGEEMKLQVTLLSVVPALGAIRLKFSRDFKDKTGQERKAGVRSCLKVPGSTFLGRSWR